MSVTKLLGRETRYKNKEELKLHCTKAASLAQVLKLNGWFYGFRLLGEKK